MGANDTANPNALLVIDPISGTVEKTVPAGSDPNLLSVSSDASYLWVAQDGDSTIQRYRLPTLQKDISFPIPTSTRLGPQQAVSLEAARINPHTLAVAAGQWSTSPAGWNIYVFDDDRQRSNTIDVLAGRPEIDWLQWGRDDSILYGTQYSTIDQPGGVVSIAVSASGVSQLPGDGGLPGGTGLYAHFSPENGVLYSDMRAADPAQFATLGEFDMLGEIWRCVPDAAIGRLYCAVQGSELWVFDLTAFKLLERVSLPHVTGWFGRLIRWGKAGLALISINDTSNGNGGLYLIDGAAINPSTAPDSSSGTVTRTYSLVLSLQPESALAGSNDVAVTVHGKDFTPNSTVCWNCSSLQFGVPTTFISSTELRATIPASALQTPGPLSIGIYDQVNNSFATNSLTFTVLPSSNTGPKFAAMNLDGLAMAWDKTRSLLYVGTGELDRAYPSHIVAVDPITATVKASVQVNSFPYLLSMSAQDQFLYVGYWKASLETQLGLPGLDLRSTWPLTTPAFQDDTSLGSQFVAGDLQAAPQNAHTSAVTLYNYAFSPAATGGVAVYDDQTQRTNTFPGWSSGNDINTLAWGKTDSVLMGSQNEDAGLQTDYLFGVDPSGLTLIQTGPTSFNGIGANIHSDFGTGLVYSDDGNVADPTDGHIVGSIGASGFVVPDSSLNRIFVLGQTQAQAGGSGYTIASFDQTNYSFVSSITVPALLGIPIGMSRCGDHCLAVITFNPDWSEIGGPVGMLYLIKDSTLISSAAHIAGTAGRLEKGDLAVRWKQISKQDILKNQRYQKKY
jgi:sugar lactone lactonase YvrE